MSLAPVHGVFRAAASAATEGHPQPHHAHRGSNAASMGPESPNHVAEIVAAYGDHVVDVRHLGPRRSRKKSAASWLGLGGLLLLGGASLFAYEAAQDWSAWQEASMSASAAGELAPEKPGLHTGGLGLGLALLGLVPLIVGGLRLRDERRPDYVIGESPDADLTVFGAESHGLVSRTDAGCRLQLLEGMQGEIVIGSNRRFLAADGPRSIDLPAGARARLEHGNMSFHVKPVPAAMAPKVRPEVDGAFFAYVGGTAMAACSLFMLARMVPADAMAVELEDDAQRQAFVNAMFFPDQQKEAEPDPITDNGDAQALGGEPGERAANEEGKMGNPSSHKSKGRVSIKGAKNTIPRIGRNFDPDRTARTAGILGVLESADAGHFLAQGGSAFSTTVGNEDEDLWGQMVGTEVGEAHGAAGMGLIGTGRGGGGMGQGVVGLSTTGTIGTKGKGGKGGMAYGNDSGSRWDGRKGRGPRVRVAKAEVQGALDKDLIRRVVRSHINEVRSCYNAGLTKDPNLQGRVVVQFMIGGGGKVQRSVVGESSIKDKGVGQCVAKAVKRWKFPRPQSGGSVFVAYPFVFNVG